MSYQQKKYLFSAIPLLILYSLLAFFVHQRPGSTFDLSMIHFIQGLETPTLTKIMRAFTFLGDVKTMIVFATLLATFLFIRNKKTALVAFVITMFGNTLLNYSMKQWMQRERPTIHRLVEIEGLSFPSGHSMMATTFFLFGAFLLQKSYPTLTKKLVYTIALFLIFAVGLSRIYLGAHFPTDVIAGFSLSGAFFFILMIFLTDKDSHS